MIDLTFTKDHQQQPYHLLVSDYRHTGHQQNERIYEYIANLLWGSTLFYFFQLIKTKLHNSSRIMYVNGFRFLMKSEARILVNKHIISIRTQLLVYELHLKIHIP